MTKVCTKCKESKALDEFCKSGSFKDGRYYWCRECCAVHKKAYVDEIYKTNVYIENRGIENPHVGQHKTCTHCSQTRPKTHFSKNRHSIDGLQQWCTPCRVSSNQLSKQKQGHGRKIANTDQEKIAC